MRLGGRLAAAIELLDLIDADARPADMLVRDYFRTRRYAGSGDRRMISGLVYGTIRSKGSIDWRLGQMDLIPSNRLRVFLQVEDSDLSSISGDPHTPAPPATDEAQFLRQAREQDADGMPDSARVNLPDWLLLALRETLPQITNEQLVTAFGPRAATDIRANSGKVALSDLQAELSDSGIETSTVDFVPSALRLSGAASLEILPSFRAGKFEVQDAGSQYAAHLVDARPGQRVADVCAGAGGKTLAMAAGMAGEGIIYASDIDGRRLKRLQARAERAGATGIETLYVGANDPWPDGSEGTMDRVLVDAPCSGSGTWRRQPEQRWRFTQQRLEELNRIQARVLDRAARLVRPGGRLVYVTCSFLRSENETVVTNFLDRQDRFAAMPWTEAAHQASLPLPSGGAEEEPWLRLSPFDHGVDGFFAAVMTRAIG